jgi:mono/diheme cytochrome c family protein
MSIGTALDRGNQSGRLKVKTSILAAAIAVVLCPLSVNAQDAGNPSAGRAFASANCAECHAIGDDGMPSPNFDAPTFASVAATPGMTGHALAAWLQTPHPTMPNFIIRPEDQANLIAYILSLKPVPAP